MTRRVPVMRPTARGGLAAAAALAEQVRVTADGAVEVAGGRAERRLPPGEVRRAVLLADVDAERLLRPDNDHQAGALVLLGDGGAPLLALLVLDWAPPSLLEPADLRASSGVDAVCRALGLPLEPAETPDLDAAGDGAALRAVLHRPGPDEPWPGRAGWPMAWGAVFASIVVLLGAKASEGGGSALGDVIGGAGGGVLALVAAVCALCVGVPSVRALAAVRRAASAPPAGLDGAVVVRPRPGGAVPARVTGHELQLTPERLLLRRYGSVVVLPGPDEGGVTQLVLEPSAVRLRGADGLLYASLSTDVWCASRSARDALLDAARSAGLQVLDAPVDGVEQLDLVELSTDGSWARLLSRRADRGEVVPGPGRLVALATGASAAATGAAYESGAPWQDAPAVVLGVACAVLTVVLSVQLLAAARSRRADAVLVEPDERAAVVR